MAELDVTELLYDPDFSDTFTVERDTETVGSNGRSTVVTETFANLIGVLTAGQGSILKQFPELTRVEGAILIHCMFELRPETSATKADRILWRGNTYRVTMVNNWMNFGGGFVSAVATLIELVEAA